MAQAELFKRQLLIRSGGQTGIDRIALDAAIAVGVPHGGVCPAGRRAEDGAIPGRYQLEEHASASYTARTKQNVLLGDGTLILYDQHIEGGTRVTCELAEKHKKPYTTVLMRNWAGREQHLVTRLMTAFVLPNDIHDLNVAGPRASKLLPGTPALALKILTCLAGALKVREAGR